MKKYIHICDDEKFIDIVIYLFESVCPNQSTYIINASQTNRLKHIKSPMVRVEDLSDGQKIIDFVRKLNSFKQKAIMFHSIDWAKQTIINKLNNNNIIVWFVWGYDLYDRFPFIKYGTYGELTKEFVLRNTSFFQKLLIKKFTGKKVNLFVTAVNYLNSKIRRVNAISMLYPSQALTAVHKIDIVVPVLQEEKSYISLLGISPAYSKFTYGYIEQLIKGLPLNRKLGNNILVGNSCALSNNHVDVFNHISKLELGDRKIIVPLSYSGNQKYKEFVIKEGKKLFGERFVPITEFLPLERYNNLISSCGYAIFNSIRQQAVGNILALSYYGINIYLNKKSPTFDHFKTLGLKIYSIDNICLTETLQEIETEQNRKILLNEYGEESVKIRTKKLIKDIEEYYKN